MSFTGQRRLSRLAGHFNSASTHRDQLEPASCSATAIRQLPRFDVTIMETYLDSHRALKTETYELFRQHPELLVAEEEGMTKGRGPKTELTGAW